MQDKQTKSNNINQAWTQTQKYEYPNLIRVRTINIGGTVTMPYLTIATLNARSVKNKDELLFQELADNSIDIGLITET